MGRRFCVIGTRAVTAGLVVVAAGAAWWLMSGDAAGARARGARLDAMKA